MLWISFLAPGPTAPQPYAPYREIGREATQLPPADLHGSRMVVAGEQGQLAGSVFWEIPQPGKVKLTIELTPDQSSGQPAQP